MSEYAKEARVASLAEAFARDISVALDRTADAQAAVVAAAGRAEVAADAALLVSENVRKLTTNATRAPLPTDNEAQGYEAGSRWQYAGQEWLRDASGWVALARGDVMLDFRAFADPTESFAHWAINRAIQAAANRGGGQVIIPLSVTVAGPIQLRTGVHLVGLGKPTITLAGGANCNVLESLGFGTLTGTGQHSTGGATAGSRCGVHGLRIDANKAGNPSPPVNGGHGVAMYARNFFVSELEVVNAARTGLWTEYAQNNGNGVSPFDGRIAQVTTDKSGEHGWYNDVSDIHATDINIRNAAESADNQFDSIWTKRGIRANNINVWSSHPTSHPRHAFSTDGGSGCNVTGLHLEGAHINLNLTGQNHVIENGLIYNGYGSHMIRVVGQYHRVAMNVTPSFFTTDKALQIGVAGLVASYCDFDLVASGMNSGLVEFVNSGGFNRIRGTSYQASGPLVIGTPASSDTIELIGTGGKAVRKVPAPGGLLAAAGTTQADATLLEGEINTVTGATATNGVRLPTAWPGLIVRVRNTSGTALQVYPAAGQQISGSAVDAPTTIAAYSYAEFMGIGTTALWVKK